MFPFIDIPFVLEHFLDVGCEHLDSFYIQISIDLEMRVWVNGAVINETESVVLAIRLKITVDNKNLCAHV